MLTRRRERFLSSEPVKVPARSLAGQSVLGLFSGCTVSGGVQASGRLAWQAVVAADDVFRTPDLLCYGEHAAEDRHPGQAFHTSSRLRAVLFSLGRRRHADVVLVWHIQLLKLLPLFRLRGSTIVAFLHGVEAWRRARRPERALLRRVDLFLSNSEHTWQRFVQTNPEFEASAHRVVPLGIGDPSEGDTPRPLPTPRALMVSRLARGEDYKGHRELLDAWPLVLQRLPNAELWIAGDGDLRAALQQMAQDRGLWRAVRFVGSVSEEAKHALIADSRCMALPSRAEGFGLVYAEAMRLGRPCLVSTLDAGREVVDPPRHGLAVDPADRAALAEAISRLLTDGPEWQQWSRLARERYERTFTARHFQQRFLSALESLVQVAPYRA